MSSIGAAGLALTATLAAGCVASGNPPPKAQTGAVTVATAAPGAKTVTGSAADPTFAPSWQAFRAFAKQRVAVMEAHLRNADPGTKTRQGNTAPADAEAPAAFAHPPSYEPFETYGSQRAEVVTEAFFKGRYNRSRARLPENVEKWRSQADIGNPGPDLANFPNSAFTLPAGRAYVEFVPFTYYGTSQSSPAQYNTEFLLRYGLTDDIELRLFGNGVAWQGGSNAAWGFAPIAFDTKINVWLEKPEYFLPALGVEAYLQTQWLGSAPFDSGTQPSISFNFDQSLPFDIDLEYNLGVTRTQQTPGQNEWEFVFQWALQRDLFDKDFAAFIHGYYNAMTLPRLPDVQAPVADDLTQDAVGAGLIWTVNSRCAMWAQSAAGTTRNSPSLISSIGLALAF
ncbi:MULTISPECIES: transporter [Methylococcus]|uniref:Transporter n=1 Tax=Methylococcus capsulatus TaxID=414 RepID=A0ABZ2FA62_METCP|nr:MULTISPECIES: transporter [Methylococcus]MDF9391174.1 transporter [Methylococcus capsulatus]